MAADPPPSRSELAISYYRAVCAALGKYVEDGGPIRVTTEVEGEETVITFVLDHERASPYFQGDAAEPQRID